MACERKFCVGGNWKLNGSLSSINALVKEFNEGTFDANKVEVIIAPPQVYVQHVASIMRPEIAVSGQNCYVAEKGAFTGEASPVMLKDIGAKWVILGHSERRNVFGESEQYVADKVAAALKAGLGVILCVGEKLEQRESGKTMEVVKSQLKPCLDKIDNWANVIIAYEPVWAIGTGKTASPEQAQDTHAEIRKYLSEAVDAKVAASTRILYGGSVKPANCDALGVKPDVDGFLVGGASLTAGFLKVINAKTE
mmetsp:Transcript_27046/g.30164  ORF Transcript_27046/g.30164 Transcript_27046/m.30164 type:complete len:252 (+) Transcript_27046:19-774(+)